MEHQPHQTGRLTMLGTLRDIENRDDIERIITAFYQTLLTDPIIGFFFTDIVQLDLPQHIPKIADFWAFQLLGEKNYRGNVFETHQRLHQQAAMMEEHFHRWLFLLHQTIDRMYQGPRAEAMKLKSRMIAKKMAQALTAGTPDNNGITGIQLFPASDKPDP